MGIRIEAGTSQFIREARRRTTTERWVGDRKADVDAFIATHPEGIFISGKGNVIRTREYQHPSGNPAVDIDYELKLNENGTGSDPSTSTGPNSQRLTTNVIQLPLESHKNYRTKWNYYLCGLGDYAKTIPPIWNTAITDFIEPGAQHDGKYMWVKSLSEIPRNPVDGKYWKIAAIPTKRGIEVYDWSVYVITDSGTHVNKGDAGWFAASKMNTIIARPDMGDFGITALLGGNWKVDAVVCYYDGKYWISEVTYTKSGDNKGWDVEIYGAVTS